METPPVYTDCVTPFLSFTQRTIGWRYIHTFVDSNLHPLSPERVMNISYPQHHPLHSHPSAGRQLPATCCYCLHLLGNAPLSAANRRELEERHVCVEKMTARQPAVSLPFN